MKTVRTISLFFIVIAIPIINGCCLCNREIVQGYYQREARKKSIGIHGNWWQDDSISNKAISRADKIWQKYADENDNAFFYRDENCRDSVYVWTYRRINFKSYITVDFINPEGEVASMTYKYPHTMQWLSDQEFNNFVISSEHNYYEYGGVGTPEFLYLSKKRYYGSMGLRPADEPQYVDTIPIKFVRNYMRDFNDYVRPFMNMHIRMADSN